MNKKNQRLRRALRTRARIKLDGKPRLSVFKTSKHIYAQIFNVDASSVLVSCSTLEKVVSGQLEYTGNSAAAAVVGKLIAERAKETGISEVSFDRSGFKYHGRIRELADAARENGLAF